MKTIEQHLQAIPDQDVKTRALHNMWWEDKHNRYLTTVEALRNAFNWSKSPEGYWYWYNVETDFLHELLDVSAEHLEKIRSKYPRKDKP